CWQSSETSKLQDGRSVLEINGRRLQNRGGKRALGNRFRALFLADHSAGHSAESAHGQYGERTDGIRRHAAALGHGHEKQKEEIEEPDKEAPQETAGLHGFSGNEAAEEA